MKQIIFATGNAGKMKEIREILDGTGWNVLSLKDAGIDTEIEENGTTFEENAKIKAEGIRNWCLENGIPGCSRISAKEIIVLADDSGLEIDWLGGEPGIYSARYMGHETSYREKNANLISRLDGVPKEKRTARFVCAIAAALSDGNRAISAGKSAAATDLDMTRFFICTKMINPRRSFPRRKKMRSVTGERRCVR